MAINRLPAVGCDAKEAEIEVPSAALAFELPWTNTGAATPESGNSRTSNQTRVGTIAIRRVNPARIQPRAAGHAQRPRRSRPGPKSAVGLTAVATGLIPVVSDGVTISCTSGRVSRLVSQIPRSICVPQNNGTNEVSTGICRHSGLASRLHNGQAFHRRKRPESAPQFTFGRSRKVQARCLDAGCRGAVRHGSAARLGVRPGALRRDRRAHCAHNACQGQLSQRQAPRAPIR